MGVPKGDKIAFVALTMFAVVMYTIPSEWIPALEPLRLALASSVIAASLMTIRRIAKREGFFFDGVRGFGLIAFGLLNLVSFYWSIVPDITQPHSIEILKLVAIYLTMVNVITTPRRLVVFSGAMVLASMVTSWHVIDWYHSGKPLVEGFRACWVGVYADPNHMAMDLGICIPLAVAFIARSKSGLLLRLVMAVAAGMAVVSLVYSHSRGGFIGMCVAMAVWTFFEKTRRMQTLALSAVLFICLVLFAPKSFWARNETLENFQQDESAMGRVHAWEVAGRMSSANPLLGVGGAAFLYAWPIYATPEAQHAYVAHNVYLDVVGELGFIGLLFFLMFTGGAAGGAFAAARSKEIGWIANGIAGAVAGYVVCDLFSGYTVTAHFYVLFGLAACAERIYRMELAKERATLPEAPAEQQPAAAASPQPVVGG